MNRGQTFRKINGYLSRLGHRMAVRARRICSVLLCVSMVITNLSSAAFTAFAAESNDEDFVYEIESEAFVEAIQEAVAEGNILNKELKFQGEFKEEYEELFDPDGTLYELDIKTLNLEKDKDRDKVLKLRVFARIQGDIPLEEEYELDGTENVLFLIQNKSDEEITVKICLDDRETELITVLPCEEIEVTDDDMEETEELEEVSDTVILNADELEDIDASKVSGAGGAAGGVGGTVGVYDDAEIFEDIDADIVIENEDYESTAEENITEDSDVSIADEADNSENEKNSGKKSAKEDDNVDIDTDNDNDDAGSDESDEGSGSSGKDSSSDDYDSDDSDVGSSGADERGDSSGNASSDDSASDSERGNSSSSDDDGSDDRGNSSKDRGSSSKDRGNRSDRSNSDSGSSESGSGKDSSSSNDSSSESSGEKTASISIRNNNILMAEKASDSDAEEASPSDASLNMLEGTIYEPVRLDNTGAVAFEMEMSDYYMNVMSLSNITFYNVTYGTNMPDVVEFVEENPDVVREDEALDFSIIIPDDYKVESVTVNENEIEAIETYEEVDGEEKYQQDYEYDGEYEVDDDTEIKVYVNILAAGDTYNITYSSSDEGIVEFRGDESEEAPVTIDDGDILSFWVVVPENYAIDSVTANGHTLAAGDSVDIDEYTRYEQHYTYSGEDGSGIHENVEVYVEVHKGQVIDGYGKFTVTDQQSDEDYTVTIMDVPTNTPVSLSYTQIEITDEAGEPVGATLVDRLYYVPDDAESVEEWIAVSYLELNGSKITDTDSEGITYYEVVAYDEKDNEFDLTEGSLWLKNTTIISARAEIMPIQTNTLVTLEGDDKVYTQTLIGAKEMSSNPQVFYHPGYQDDYMELIRLTNGKEYKFYYGELGSTRDDGYKDISKLKECVYGQIVESETTNDAGETIYEYNIYPLDENNEVVKDTTLYIEYDKVYSFDVEYESIVNEHTEDNGDVYLWMGKEYYVDKYHNQGNASGNYTRATKNRPADGEEGVWVQLADIRTPLINKQEKTFKDYESVTKDQLKDEGVTEAIVNAVSANYNYGIAGPYTVADGATDVVKYTTRVTGHIGDEYVASEVFDTETVYMITDVSQLHETEWVDLGATGPGYGQRCWWYWINDYYQLNNYEDELEFVAIVEREDEDTGEMQVRLEADEMGKSGLGEDFDVWSIDLITKRNSVVKEDMLTNPTKYTDDGVGFSNVAGLPHHIQLRIYGTFETIGDNGETYFGELTVLADEDPETHELGDKAPYIDYNITAIQAGQSVDDAITLENATYVYMDSDQEAESISFVVENYDETTGETTSTNYYIPQEYMYDDTQVKITVKTNFIGTLTSDSGEIIEYTEDDPYVYEGTLTAAQLMEAYDTCPNSSGYDFAVNLSEAIHTNISTDTETIIYKIWDDNTNAYSSRGNVDGVVVTLERSQDGSTWENVMDKDDPTKVAEFTILPPLLDEDSESRDINANQWSLVLSEEDLDLTYGEGDDQGYYEFRIATEEFKDGEETNSSFTYNTIITGTSVTNTLVDQPIDITGKKLWEDADGTPLENVPTNSVILTLYQNGHYFSRQTVSADNNWTFSFTNLPKWNGTEEYIYTLGEMMEDGTSVGDGQSVLIGQDWFHIEFTENDDGTYTFANVKNHDQIKDVDVPEEGESEDEKFGDNGVGVKVGDTVTYKIEYTNYYPTPSDIIITDVVDEGLTYVSSQPDAEVSTNEENHTVLMWTIEDVEAKASGSVTFTATVNENALIRNEIDNTASVKVADDPAVDTNTVYNPVPDKNVDADGDEIYDDSGMLTQIGSTLVYKIDYENPDDDVATVTIKDVLDDGLDYISSTDNGSYDKDSRTITWTLEDVEAHTSGSVYFTAIVNENATVVGYVENKAFVQVGNHEGQYTKTVTNPVPGKGVDTDKNGEYDDNGESVQVGDIVSYEISYSNGYETAATVTITDKLDDGLTYISSEPEGTYDSATHTLTWVIENVAALTNDSVIFTAKVNENAMVLNAVDNTATVQVGDDPDTAVNTNTTHNPIPDKNVDADGDEVYEDSGMLTTVGSTLVYKIDYENPDDEAATVKITDELDIGLDYVSSNPEGSYDETSRILSWTITDVDAHTKGSVYFTAIVNENATEAGYIKNTAVVKVGNHDEQNTKTVYNPVPSKDVDADEDEAFGDNGEDVYIGETLTYKISYYNGYETSATVIITDVLDEGLTYVEGSATGGGSYDPATRTITWTIENVASLTGDSVTFQAIVNEAALMKEDEDEVTNKATVTIKAGDNSETTVETNEVENPVPSKDVDVDPNDDHDYGDDGVGVTVGSTLTYKIHYFNAYDDPEEITIIDKLDPNLEYVEGSATAGDNITYVAEYKTYEDGEFFTITWTISDVQSHEGGNVTFKAIVLEGALETNELDNMASVQVGNHLSVDTNTVHNPVPDKNVDANGDEIFDDSGMQVQLGAELVYKIDYENPDDEAATVAITDTLDVGLTYVSSNPEAAVSTDDDGNVVLSWTIENVGAHKNGSVYFTATVNEDALVKNYVENTATVQVGDHPEQQTKTVYNPVPGKDVDVDGDGNFGDNGDSIIVGSTLTYEISYFNGYASPSDATATITITDTLDEGLDYVAGSASAGGTYDESTRTITWIITNVGALEGGSVTFQATVNEDALIKNEVENDATVELKYGDNPSTKVETNPLYNPLPDKDVDANNDDVFNDSGMQVSVGDTLTYKISYQNSDDEPATVTITDELDIGLTFIEASDGGTYDAGSRTITWVLDNVAPHSEEGYFVTFSARVNEDAVEKNVVENTAIVQVGEHEAQQTKTVYNPVPGKDVDIHGDDTFGDNEKGINVGDVLTYEIDYYNGYDKEAVVIITDELDDGLDYVEGSASDGGKYDESTHTITWTLTAAAGEQGSVTFKAKVNEQAAVTDLVENTASVKIDNDSAVTNTVRNHIREYYPIDEEIVTNQDDIFDRDNWVKDTSVNEYNAIMIEMTTRLPIVEPDDLLNGSFTMNFHEVLDSHMSLDEIDSDFSVYIDGNKIDHQYYIVTFGNVKTYTGNGIATLTGGFGEPVTDECSFHVDVDLTALYKDGIVTDDMLEGDTEITIFFYADLEGTGLNGSYTSTVWYDIYDGSTWLYTADPAVVSVYTYEIDINKTSSSTGNALSGATFGVYYDATCEEPVYRYYGQGYDDGAKVAYTATSDSNGMARFYGLAAGTYYVKELSAPSGYILRTTVYEVILGDELTDHTYGLGVSNTPSSSRSGGSGGSGGGSGSSGGSGVGGPGSSGGSEGEGDTWDLLPLSQTGQGRAMLFGGIALAVSAMALVVLLWYKRREKSN